MTAVAPPGRYGAVDVEGDVIRVVRGRSRLATGRADQRRLSSCSPSVLDRIEGDPTRHLGAAPLESPARTGQRRLLRAYKPLRLLGNCMDTLRDAKTVLKISAGGHAPWKAWA